MLTLPQEYKVKGQRGFIYRQVKREGDVVLSEQIAVEEGEGIVAWEAFVVQKYPDRWSPDGKTFIAAKEAPPRSELWGSAGFTCTTLAGAEVRFAQLLAAQALKAGVIAEGPVVGNEDGSVTFKGTVSAGKKVRASKKEVAIAAVAAYNDTKKARTKKEIR